jgi:hypothetical protein
MQTARREGCEAHTITLAEPSLVFRRAAQTFGLNCRLCGTLCRTAGWEPAFVCVHCEIRSRWRGGIEAAIAVKIASEVRRLRKRQRETQHAG